ncbi:hypothetical protein OFC08_35600, partial [Escherichia coli]|nr:hypothetical protein [Escherichia coli]
MNYCIVVFFIVLVISTIQWFVDGRKNYHGPNIEMDGTVLTAIESVRGTGGRDINQQYATQKEREAAEADRA